MLSTQNPSTRLQNFKLVVDQTAPFMKLRWIVFTFFLLVFTSRVIVKDGYYIIAYALGIFLLLTLVTFLTPKAGLPSEGPDRLPLHEAEDDEFRPFIRKLPEFKAWKQATLATLSSLFASFLPFLDIPVYLPILVLYFIGISFAMLRVHVEHWIKYRYLPFSFGKKQYSRRRSAHSESTGSVGTQPTIVLPSY
ncbi:hypothetical protein P9112_005540 [Eukaryota sp. TZLM1-RC]